MKPNCEHCSDTGRVIYANGEHSAFLDCAKCGIAQERVELAAFVQDFCANYSGMAELLPEELNYAIHQRARKQPLPINMLTVKIDADHAINMLREVLSSDESIRQELMAAGWVPPIYGAPTRRDTIEAASRAIYFAECAGLVLTVSQVPRKPLAAGNYDTRIEVREKVVRP